MLMTEGVDGCAISRQVLVPKARNLKSQYRQGIKSYFRKVPMLMTVRQMLELRSSNGFEAEGKIGAHGVQENISCLGWSNRLAQSIFYLQAKTVSHPLATQATWRVRRLSSL
jgi:hypothetical protein